MKFTDLVIRKLQPKDKEYVVRGDMGGGKRGFALRVRPNGTKSFTFIYEIEGKRYTMALGNYPDVGLAEASEKFDDAWKVYRAGQNPGLIKRTGVETRKNAFTVADLVDEFINKHSKIHKRRWEDDERMLKKEIIPTLGSMKAEDVTKRDITLVLEAMVERGSPASSNQCLKIARKMFNFAVERDILQISPCISVKALAPNRSRERALSEDEIRILWNNLDQLPLSSEVVRAMRLILVTAQRPGEVCGMHANELDGHWWTIPVERSKNKQAHRVYLTDTALNLINVGDNDGYIFRCPHKAKLKPIEAHALAAAVRRNLLTPVVDENGQPVLDAKGKPVTENKIGIAHFTPHDLRRTAATFMARAGEMDEVIDAVLNHKKQGVIRVYNQYRYDKEKQSALESWSRKLDSIVTSKKADNVIQLKRKKK